MLAVHVLAHHGLFCFAGPVPVGRKMHTQMIEECVRDTPGEPWWAGGANNSGAPLISGSQHSWGQK